MLLGGNQKEGRAAALAEQLAGPGPLSDAEMEGDGAAPISRAVVRVRHSAGSSMIQRVEVPKGASLHQQRDGSWIIKLKARASERNPRLAGKKSASERLLSKFLSAQLRGSAHARHEHGEALLAPQEKDEHSVATERDEGRDEKKGRGKGRRKGRGEGRRKGRRKGRGKGRGLGTGAGDEGWR